MSGWVLTGVSTDLLLTLTAALGGAVVLLYVLRLRRRRVQVPFSPLWQKILAEQQATNLWERLKRLISLLIALIILGLLLLALGDPRSLGALEEGRSVVLIIDASASMSAMDEEGARSRLDRATDEARAVIDSLGARDELMLVRMDGQLQPLTPFVDGLRHRRRRDPRARMERHGGRHPRGDVVRRRLARRSTAR